MTTVKQKTIAPRERKGMSTSLFSQVRKLASFLVSIYIPAAAALCAAVLASVQMDVSVGLFTRDPATIANIHPFYGAISNLGVLLWTASATVCLFGWGILRRTAGGKRFSTFLLCSGLMTILLLIDDFFLLHDDILSYYFGINETAVFIVYAGLMAAGLVRFRKCILETEYLVLVLALCFFGASVAVDAFQDQIQSWLGSWRILLEDGFKLFGIVGWFGYFLRICLSRIR